MSQVCAVTDNWSVEEDCLKASKVDLVVGLSELNRVANGELVGIHDLDDMIEELDGSADSGCARMAIDVLDFSALAACMVAPLTESLRESANELYLGAWKLCQ